MRDLFQRIKMDVVISALVCIAFGVVLILWPVQVTTVACKAIGVALAVLGLIRLAGHFRDSVKHHRLNFPLGLALFVIGVWIYLKPGSIQSMLLIGIGVVLFVHGFENFKYGLEAKRNGYESWAILLLLAVFGMALGVACMINCFGVISVTLTFVGIALIYDGVSDLWIISRVGKAAKGIRRAVEEMQPIDAEAVDFSEEDEMWQK